MRAAAHRLRLPFALALAAPLLVAPLTAGAHDGPDKGFLVATHSGLCLGGGGAPGVVPCSPEAASRHVTPAFCSQRTVRRRVPSSSSTMSTTGEGGTASCIAKRQ